LRSHSKMSDVSREQKYFHVIKIVADK
jgi:hypothetical protein